MWNWFRKVETGKFHGRAGTLTPIGPDMYQHAPSYMPLTFERPDGSFVVLDFRFETDIGSIPPQARIHNRLSKGYYNIAYLFHDAEFAKKEKGMEHLSFAETNRLCAEVIRTLQVQGFRGNRYQGSHWIMRAIYGAISSPIGYSLWKKAGAEQTTK